MYNKHLNTILTLISFIQRNIFVAITTGGPGGQRVNFLFKLISYSSVCSERAASSAPCWSETHPLLSLLSPSLPIPSLPSSPLLLPSLLSSPLLSSSLISSHLFFSPLISSSLPFSTLFFLSSSFHFPSLHSLPFSPFSSTNN